MVAVGHDLASGTVTPRRIATAQHVGVSRRGRTRGAFDDILDQLGLARKVVAVVPTFTAAAQIIASSELTGLITARHAAQVAALTGAHIYEIPCELPRLPISQAWHVRHDLDPAQQWLRAQVAGTLGVGGDLQGAQETNTIRSDASAAAASTSSASRRH
jgi:DNA-binding transcriptional LysR family regulator